MHVNKFEKGKRYLSRSGTVLEYCMNDSECDPHFKIIGKNRARFGANDIPGSELYGLVGFKSGISFEPVTD